MHLDTRLPGCQNRNRNWGIRFPDFDFDFLVFFTPLAISHIRAV
jgi:hypothetical protein